MSSPYSALVFHRWLGPDSNYKYHGTLADWSVAKGRGLGADTPHTQSAAKAAELVLAQAGASLHRNAVDKRIIENVLNRKGKVIDSEAEVGGWPELHSLPAPLDSDHDSLPDDWERTHGLNPNDPSDRNGKTDQSGYTNLENYLNSLCK